jgi:hypothetical protein
LKESHPDQDSAFTETSVSLATAPNTFPEGGIDDDENPNPKLRLSLELPEITRTSAKIRGPSGEIFGSAQREELQPTERAVRCEEIANANQQTNFLIT